MQGCPKQVKVHFAGHCMRCASTEHPIESCPVSATFAERSADEKATTKAWGEKKAAQRNKRNTWIAAKRRQLGLNPLRK